MFVRLTDIKGKPVWINPIHVRAVRQKSKFTEIVVPYHSPMGQTVLKAREPAEEVVETLNRGMSGIMAPFIPEDEPSAGGLSAGAMGI